MIIALFHMNTVWHVAAIATIIGVVRMLLPIIRHRTQLAKFPLLNGSLSREEQRKVYLESAHSLYLDGYRKYKTDVYRMPTLDGEQHLVIPPNLMSDFRKLDDSVLGFYPEFEKVLESKYTNALKDLSKIAHAVRSELTPALVRLNPIIYEEVCQAMAEDMPSCSEWTPLSAYMTIINMVAKVTGRVFVGADLCRSPAFLDNAVNYAIDVFAAVRDIKRIRPWLRPILAPRLPSVQKLRRREEMAKNFFEAVVQKRLDAEASNDDSSSERPDDMLSAFMLSARSSKHGSTASELAMLQLGVVFAAVHTTSETMTHILYDLAASPAYIPALRAEIRAIMAQHENKITTRALQQMMKLDSFMRESLRLHPPLVTVSHRTVLRSFTFSNGQFIPAGSSIALPSRAVSCDASNYPNGLQFDGYRHYKLREGGTASDHARNQFVTSNEQSLTFGLGRHACPGRFFAANEIKMLLAKIILRFDVKNEDGSLQRYPDHELGTIITPDTKRNLLFRQVEQ